MKDDELVNENQPLVRPVDLFYKRYSFLLRPTRELGKSATKAFMNIGTLIQKTASMSTMDELLSKAQISTDQKKKTIEKDAQLKKLNKIVAKSNEVLATATAVFPFDLFPDTVTLDRTKVTITKRSFFWSAEVISIRIEDILNVTTGVGPFFGSLTVASRVMSSVDHFTINYFWRKDAIRLKHIIQGYVIAHHNNIDITNLSKRELTTTLTELGHDAIS
ncbi:MAG: hypothetical protein Q7T74_02810 [Candidatus Saccharibacteria bacterium]|nr:hypothetical protein [Candidatus Saccharibacteria bacterium]